MFYHKGLVVKSFVLFTFLLLYTSSTYSQRPVTRVTLVSVPFAPLTYTEDSNTYTWGQSNDLILEEIQYNSETYFVQNSFSQLDYVNNRASVNGGISYDRCGISLNGIFYYQTTTKSFFELFKSINFAHHFKLNSKYV